MHHHLALFWSWGAKNRRETHNFPGFYNHSHSCLCFYWKWGLVPTIWSYQEEIMKYLTLSSLIPLSPLLRKGASCWLVEVSPAICWTSGRRNDTAVETWDLIYGETSVLGHVVDPSMQVGRRIASNRHTNNRTENVCTYIHIFMTACGRAF